MKKLIFLFSLLFLFNGCSESDSNPETPKTPTVANLVFPFENYLCNEGSNLTLTESTVLFEWEASEYTDSYELFITNLTSNKSSFYQISNTTLSVVILRGTPYEWYVISKSNSSSNTSQSETWQFYNAANGVQSYAPFPAEIISPAMAETITNSPSEITLDWEGRDVDDDIVAYDIYLGTETSPTLFKSNVSESILNNVSVSTNTIYFWKIVTIDSMNNKSYSTISQFKIE
ncbi:hypothetical protein SAMN05444411_102306 [Lutibacter oricola]|uniref:Fibronectin type-III domain-containing protein n=1 Tax=Lutibacter oricola TaxID=762486 RepID=A0A1H2WWW6_9FLAO|nr:hypothetical protein [Lutibacter oricola]SDW84998.1 hypothetical protein SAMN05444411_102306 [Lutibacter oricola]